MFPNLDFLDIPDAPERSQDRNFYAQLRQLISLDRHEPGIFQSGAQNTVLHDFVKFPIGIQLADAAAEIIPAMQRYKSAFSLDQAYTRRVALGDSFVI